MIHITPLSPASGVLEWVDSTMCFGDFLTDRGKKVGAHSRYYTLTPLANSVHPDSSGRSIYDSITTAATKASLGGAVAITAVAVGGMG